MTLFARTFACAALLSLAGVALAADQETPAVLKFDMKTLDGKPAELSQYAGKVVLIVNVASRCGYTPQYNGLQSLHEKYADKGLVVLGVPCNQFGGQEPGTAEEIATFCSTKYKVGFPMLAKVDVNGPGACELYQHLTAKGEPAGPVKWNFEKFLIGRDGSVVGRFGSAVKPDSDKLVSAVEAELAK